jgi:hypothetical protein
MTKTFDDKLRDFHPEFVLVEVKLLVGIFKEEIIIIIIYFESYIRHNNTHDYR